MCDDEDIFIRLRPECNRIHCLKGCEEHQVCHVDLYIHSGMGSNESDTHDSLKNI